MKHVSKWFNVIAIVALLVAMLPVLTASAALPPDMSWVKWASNPVVPKSTCATGITPARPAVLFESANNYKMYFTTHPGVNGAQIYLATTTNGGLNWTCENSGNPVLTLGASGAWDAARVTTASVVKVDATHYQMWYTGINAAGNYAIGYAESPDGVAWTKYVSNPVLTLGGLGTWDSAIIREPSVVLIGGTYHMYYSGTSKWPYFKIGHATSTNGTAWTKDAANPVLNVTSGSWDSNEVYAPSVVLNGAVYEMFYSGNSGGAWLTGHASSNDGVTWVKDGNAIISPSATGWDNADSTDYVAAVLDGATWKVFYSGAGKTTGYQIGLATLTDQAQLTFNPLATNVAVGNNVVVNIDLNAVANMYGYQFQVNYDTTKVTASAAFVNSFFDTTGQLVPPLWNAVCSGGVCQFAVTRTEAASGISGSGTLAQITFTGIAAGDVPLTFSSDILSDKDANRITHSVTTGFLTVLKSVVVSGVVNMQGRTYPTDTPGSVTIYDKYGYAPSVTTSFSASDGTWTANVAVNPASTTFDIQASHGLYLTNRKTGIDLSGAGPFPQGTTRLLGGDANNDGIVYIGDLTCVGGDFGTANNNCVGGNSDINADLTVNILDLVLVGGNYNLTAPRPW